MLLIRNPVLIFLIPLPELFKKLPDIVVNQACDPLDDMESIHDRDGIWEILVHIGKIRVVHVGDKIFDGGSFYHGDGDKVWRRYV